MLTNKYGNCVINKKKNCKTLPEDKMLRMKMAGRGFRPVRPDYLSFKAPLNPCCLEFSPIQQALFTPLPKY
jgi:hypothetical protein